MSLKVLGLMAYFMLFFASSRASFIYIYIFSSVLRFFVPVKIQLAKLGTVVKRFDIKIKRY